MASSGTPARLGVDLGTTWTAAALLRAGAASPEPLTLGDRGAAMPSVVAVSDGGVVTGDAAERVMLNEPSAGVREPKRRLGDTTPYVVAGTPYGSEALMGHLLRAAVDAAEQAAGARPTEVVLTHPANWGEYKVELLREAARLAGVDGITFVTEPEAAAAHYVRLGRVARGQTVAVYDFGGGTFDAAVVRCSDTGTEVLGQPEGLERLGGLDLDEAVLAHVDAALDGKLRELDPDDAAVRKAMAQLRVECTKAKEALSADSETTIAVAFPGLVTDLRMTRDEFESAIRARLDDTLAALDRALSSAGVTPDDLAGVLLVGGSSRIPLVAEQVASHTGRPVLVDADAKLVVALGAAGATSIATSPVAAAAAGGDQEDVMDDKTADDRAAGAAGATGKGKEGGADDTAKPGERSGKKAAASKGSGGAPAGAQAGKRKVSPGAVAAGAAGVAGVAGLAAAGVAGAEMLGDDGGAPAEESLDAFDEAGSDLGAFGVGPEAGAAGPAGAGGAGGGGGGAGGGGGSAGGVARAGGGGGAAARAGGRTAARHDDGAPSSGGGGQATAPYVTDAGTTTGGATAGDDPLAYIRQQLHERLDAYEAPEGADPEEIAELREELAGLVDRYQPMPGQPMDEAIAELRDRFDDKVEDFARDQRIDALIEEEQREQAEADALTSEVDRARVTLQERLDAWEPPPGTDPAAAEELRQELAALVDDYVPVPGSTPEQAIAELERRFDNEVKDFAQDQKIDALVGLETETDMTETDMAETDMADTATDVVGMDAETDMAETGDVTQEGAGATDDVYRPEVTLPADALADSAVAAPVDAEPSVPDGVMTAPPVRDGLADVFDDVVADTAMAADDLTLDPDVVSDPAPVGQPRPAVIDPVLDDVLGDEQVVADSPVWSGPAPMPESFTPEADHVLADHLDAIDDQLAATPEMAVDPDLDSTLDLTVEPDLDQPLHLDLDVDEPEPAAGEPDLPDDDLPA